MIELNVKQRLLLVALVPASLLSVVMAAYFTLAGVRALDTELRQRGLAMVRYLAPASEYGVISGQQSSLQVLVQNVEKQPGVKAVLVVGAGGKILAVSGRVSLSVDEMRRPLSEPEVVGGREGWLAFGASIRQGAAEADELFEPDASATVGQSEVGKVFVELSTASVFEQQQMLLVRSLLIVLVGLALAATIAVRTASRAVRPLNALVDVVRRMSGGDYQARVTTATPGEFGVLERGFNEMAEHIEASRRDLQWRIEEATAHLAYQARHDALTGLINRREFETRLEEAIGAVQGGAVDVCVLFMDLDRFKVVNDTAGHLAGDDLLRQLGRLFHGRLRERDTLARIGGDEFAAILPDCNQEQARHVAEDLCRLIANYRFVWQSQVFSIGISVGLVQIGGAMKTNAAVLTAGDAACYAAKEAGGNRLHIHTSTGLVDHAPGRERWRERIESALRERRLRCDATPIRPLAGCQHDCLLAEVSLSIDDRDDLPITAPVLRDMAERAGLAPLVDERLLEIALASLARVQEEKATVGPPILIVQLSMSSIKSQDNAERIISLVRRAEGRSGLCVALPEEAVIRNIGEAGLLCAALHDAGIKVALTDFGGWLASFNHLDVVLPELIRINRGLIHDLRRHKSAHALVRAIQEVSVDRGIHTIAPDLIETADMQSLKELGIHFGEGRAVAPVVPLDVWIDGCVLRTA